MSKRATQYPKPAGGFRPATNLSERVAKQREQIAAARGVAPFTCKRAVVVGCNYADTDMALHGCINDAYSIRDCLFTYFGYKSQDVVLLTDHTVEKPTRATILQSLKRMLETPQLTHFVFAFSGHGTGIPDKDGDDSDGQDEAMVALDGQLIIDDELNALFSRLSPKAQATCIIDCCHSGTMLDLPFTYDPKLRVFQRTEKPRLDTPNVIEISGCRDSETAAEMHGQGALTSAFCTLLKEKCAQLQVRDLIDSLNTMLPKGQHCMLTAGRKFQTAAPFQL